MSQLFEVPTISIGKISGQLAKLAAAARRREYPTAVLETFGTQLRSIFEQRKRILRRRTSMLATVPVATPVAPANQAIAAHVTTLVQKRLNRLDRTRRFESTKDPAKAVHDLRVASRRLRAFVEVFEPILEPPSREARKSLRSITRAARPVRDLHVQLGYLRDCHAHSTSDIERVVFEELIVRIEDKTRHHERRLRKELKKLNFDKVRTSLSTAVGQTVVHWPSTEQELSTLTWQLIEPLAGFSTQSIRSSNPEEQPEKLHELRISLKKLRYALEIFEPVFGEAFPALYEPIESLQELLGRHHDLYVLECYVKQQRIDLERGKRTTIAGAMRVLEHKLSARRHALHEDVVMHGFEIARWRQAVLGLLRQPSSIA